MANKQNPPTIFEDGLMAFFGYFSPAMQEYLEERPDDIIEDAMGDTMTVKEYLAKTTFEEE